MSSITVAVATRKISHGNNKKAASFLEVAFLKQSFCPWPCFYWGGSGLTWNCFFLAHKPQMILAHLLRTWLDVNVHVQRFLVCSLSLFPSSPVICCWLLTKCRKCGNGMCTTLGMVSLTETKSWEQNTIHTKIHNLGKWSNLTNIFQRGWNHQLVKVAVWTLKGWYDLIPFCIHLWNPWKKFTA